MEAYLRNYGYHFSKKMYEWAVSMMKDRNKQPIKTMERDELKTLLADLTFMLWPRQTFSEVRFRMK